VKACSECGSTTAELRPYGLNGASICYACAMATPERKARATAALDARLDAIEASGGEALIGGEDGPVPIAPAIAAVLRDLRLRRPS